ncbi:uncharacterized protein [Rutidosis leptorrhynchoides]|uniref:uncharacterized protein n=1 Tax=Rutidosis leptorrhynchoides TaxID=125765 RepID=UPI003A99D517
MVEMVVARQPVVKHETIRCSHEPWFLVCDLVYGYSSNSDCLLHICAFLFHPFSTTASMAPSGKYDKLYTITYVDHLIPIKLDLAKMNYSHWSTLFSNHCHAFNVHNFFEAATSSDPPDEETRKADAVVLGWIFLTISEPILERLLNSQPKTAYDGWEKNIFQDNKHSKTVELTAELRSLNMGDLNAERYFRKVESISAMLTNLGAKIEEDELVTYAINGLNERFPHAHHIILHSNPFLSFNTVRSTITLEEMQLSRKNCTTVGAHGTPSAPTVLVAQASTQNTGTSHSNTNPQVCRNFNRGHCRFAEKCRYLHHQSRPASSGTTNNTPHVNGKTQAQLLEIIVAQQLLLAQQGNTRAVNSPVLAPFDFWPRTPLAHLARPPGYPSPGPQAYYVGSAPYYMPTGPTSVPRKPQIGLNTQQPAHYYNSLAAPPTAIGPGQPVSAQIANQSSLPTMQQPTSQETLIPHAFSTTTLPDYCNAGWHMDTGASTHLTSNINNLSTIFNNCMYPSVVVSDGNTLPVTNTGHSVLSNIHRPLYLSNVLVTPNIIKNLIFVRRFTRDNKVSVCFDEFGFSVKDYLTRRLLLRCDSTGDLYPFTNKSSTPAQHALLTTSTTWHQRLGHPSIESFRRLVSNNSIVCNKTKSPEFCHACQLGKHVRLPFSSSSTHVTSAFDIIHSDLWTSPVLSLSGFKYYVLFLDHYSHYIWLRQQTNSTPENTPPASPTNNTPPTSPTSPPPQNLPIPPPPQNPTTTNSTSTHPMVTCHRVGTTKPVQCLNLHISTISPIPTSYPLAFKDPNWQHAMTEEYNALIKNGTWTLVPRPSDTNIVLSMWLFKHKFNADGTLSRYKARLVANGRSQQVGIDCDETFIPVVKPATIRTVLSLAISRHWPVHQLDVKNAFLHGHLTETVYMHQPPGFRDPTRPDHRFARYAQRVGFQQSRCDTSLFIYHQGTDTAYLLLYVEDIILTASSAAFLWQVIVSLHQEFSMTDLGPLNYFLGISVTRNSSGMFLSQKKYATEILERADMTGCHPSRTLVETSSKLNTSRPPIANPTLYRSLAEALQYLTFTRYRLCSSGTLDLGLQLFASSTTSLTAYSDADWAGFPSTRRSTSGDNLAEEDNQKEGGPQVQNDNYYTETFERINSRPINATWYFIWGPLDEANMHQHVSRLLAIPYNRIVTYAWEHVFSIREPIFPVLLKEFYSTVRFNNVRDYLSNDFLRFRLGGENRGISKFELCRVLGIFEELTDNQLGDYLWGSITLVEIPLMRLLIGKEFVGRMHLHHSDRADIGIMRLHPGMIDFFIDLLHALSMQKSKATKRLKRWIYG